MTYANRTTFRFTQAVKDQWCNALESGDFKQGTRMLYHTGVDRYCCLGVLAKLNDALDGRGYARGTGCGGGLSDICDVPHARQLMDLNDHQGRDFKYIAGFIREYCQTVPEDNT